MLRASILLLVLVGGCPGPNTDAPQFTGSISGAAGANNALSSLSFTEFTGAVSSGAPDLTTFSADNPGTTSTAPCPSISIAAVGRPTTGGSYQVVAGQDVSFGNDTKPGDANLVYCERSGGCQSPPACWTGSGGGTIAVDSVSGMRVAIHFSDVPMVGSSTATGTFRLSGSGTTGRFQ